MKPRLSPEERDKRAAARRAASWARIKDGSAYKHYDPTVEGYGSAKQWRDTVERLAAGLGALIHTAKAGISPDLALLGLESLPSHVDGLQSAFRKASFKAHPDHGGTSEKFRDLFAAFERLLNHYKK
jgi:hypothetical protein